MLTKKINKLGLSLVLGASLLGSAYTVFAEKLPFNVRGTVGITNSETTSPTPLGDIKNSNTDVTVGVDISDRVEDPANPLDAKYGNSDFFRAIGKMNISHDHSSPFPGTDLGGNPSEFGIAVRAGNKDLTSISPELDKIIDRLTLAYTNEGNGSHSFASEVKVTPFANASVDTDSQIMYNMVTVGAGMQQAKNTLGQESHDSVTYGTLNFPVIVNGTEVLSKIGVVGGTSDINGTNGYFASVFGGGELTDEITLTGGYLHQQADSSILGNHVQKNIFAGAVAYEGSLLSALVSGFVERDTGLSGNKSGFSLILGNSSGDGVFATEAYRAVSFDPENDGLLSRPFQIADDLSVDKTPKLYQIVNDFGVGIDYFSSSAAGGFNSTTIQALIAGKMELGSVHAGGQVGVRHRSYPVGPGTNDSSQDLIVGVGIFGEWDNYRHRLELDLQRTLAGDQKAHVIGAIYSIEY